MMILTLCLRCRIHCFSLDSPTSLQPRDVSIAGAVVNHHGKRDPPSPNPLLDQCQNGRLLKHEALRFRRLYVLIENLSDI